MTLATVNRLIGVGVVIPVVVGIWGFTSSNPYLVILVALIGAAVSFALILTGTLVGGVKIIRGNAEARTRDLFLFAVGANVLLLGLCIAFVVFGGRVPNSASVTDACGRRSRAFFSAAQRGR